MRCQPEAIFQYLQGRTIIAYAIGDTGSCLNGLHVAISPIQVSCQADQEKDQRGRSTRRERNYDGSLYNSCGNYTPDIHLWYFQFNVYYIL
jgi:hypothetical protein